MLTRVNHAKDWGNGIELANALLGRSSSLEVHHIFPKHLLYQRGYSKSLVNALANYSFLTKETNIKISDKDPAQYIPECMKANPGAVESHWMPVEQELLLMENYEKFLAARRSLLADCANDFLISLLEGKSFDVEIQDFANRDMDGIDVKLLTDEEGIILDVSNWMKEKGFFEGIINYELVDEAGNLLMIIDIAWPQGIQAELSEPAALLIDESEQNQKTVNEHGYRYFTLPDEFKAYVNAHYVVD